MPEYILVGLFFAGLLSFLFILSLYSNVIMHWLVPVSIILVAGIVATSITREHFVSAFSNSKNLYLHLGVNLVAAGGLVCLVFMLLVVYVRTGEPYVKTYNMKKWNESHNRITGCNRSAIIDLAGEDKTLEFPCSTQLAGYSYMHLTLQKSVFGFEVITKKEPSIFKESIDYKKKIEDGMKSIVDEMNAKSKERLEKSRQEFKERSEKRQREFKEELDKVYQNQPEK